MKSQISNFKFVPALLGSVVLGVCVATSPAQADEGFIPRKQSKPPTPALSPQEAIKKMTVPPGFTVELVAAEPDIMNPVAMAFDERGRIWVTESFEYPRKEPGPGRDRVKILEDADGDGTAEKVTVFAEGLNIPSGIAVGAGGVWVANAPDILFYPDADRDGVADAAPQVVLTGFGRDDTHELPNSLTWGPDGWLYGLNGVFNNCHVCYGKDNPNFAKAEADKHPGWKFTCAMFRIHPRTREFQIFCEGTSNPWGIAFNENGDAFVSACVIDHLWHLVETGYYHRQGGPYPPHTWKLESIVDYKHQMAAYCGITWFDSDAYPAEYRGKLYMGNIHGGCINVDGLVRKGATYKGVKHDDFLTANDVWFMPVVQKVGPDGCLYILDWYDRYHCYQDANYDPPGVDRAKGRLYRVRYKDTPRAAKFDLAKETDDQLIERLASPNVYYREQAQRVLAERLAARRVEQSTLKKLQATILNASAARHARLFALWSIAGGDYFTADLSKRLAALGDPVFRAWNVRLAGDAHRNAADFVDLLTSAATDDSADVRIQAIIAAPKLLGDQAVQTIVAAADSPRDPLVAPVAWQNLLPLLPSRAGDVADHLARKAEGIYCRLLLRRFVAWAISIGPEESVLAARIAADMESKPELFGPLMYEEIARTVCDDQVSQTTEQKLRELIEPRLCQALPGVSQGKHYLLGPALELGCRWKNPEAIRVAKAIALESDPELLRRLGYPTGRRDSGGLRALAALYWASSHDPEFITKLPTILGDDGNLLTVVRIRLFDALTKYESPGVGDAVISIYPDLSLELRPAAIELLTSRAAWADQLLDAIDAGKISKDAVNVNQVRKLLKLGDKALAARVEATWGKLRTDRNPQREQVVNKMRDMIRNGHGDALRGQAVFGKLCGQCHKIHGQGQEVGPDITVNGRSNFEQLLSNIFDPSLVIGSAYQPRIVTTGDGRVLTGLLVEDSPQRVVLKLQGGKLETIARANIDEIETSKLSLMPEGVETQYKPQEVIDLFAFLRLDKPPTDPAAKTLPGFAELDEAWNRN